MPNISFFFSLLCTFIFHYYFRRSASKTSTYARTTISNRTIHTHSHKHTSIHTYIHSIFVLSTLLYENAISLHFWTQEISRMKKKHFLLISTQFSYNRFHHSCFRRTISIRNTFQSTFFFFLLSINS